MEQVKAIIKEKSAEQLHIEAEIINKAYSDKLKREQEIKKPPVKVA